MSESAIKDAIVVLMNWSDGSHACFFENDADAIGEYIKQKNHKNRGLNLECKVKKYLKSEYDKLKWSSLDT